MLRALATALVGVSAACSFGGQLGDGYQCGEGGACPAGQVCEAGFCVADPSVDAAPDAPIDPDAPDADVPTARCGTVYLLRDEFDAAGPGPYWYAYADTGASVSESGGHLVVQLGAGAGFPYAGYTSRFRYDLTGAALEASVVGTDGRSAILEVRTHQDYRIQLVKEDAVLYAAIFNAPDEGTLDEIAFDPTTHRYWRIREGGGTLYWETSVDRITWLELHSIPVPFDLTHVAGALAGGGQLATAEDVRFDDVGRDAPATAYCPTADLVEGFDGDLEPTWNEYTAANCTNATLNGRLQQAFSGNATGFCGVTSAHLYDLTASALVIDVSQVPAPTGFVAYVEAAAPHTGGDTRVAIAFEDGSIRAEQVVDGSGTNTSSRTFEPDQHRFVRLRGDGGRIYLEVSADAATWTTLLSPTAAFDLSNVVVNLGGGHYNATGDPVLVRWGGVNAP